MTAGRRPKPTWLKKVEGNPGRRPLNPDEPKPELVTTLVCPPHFDDERRTMWGRACEILHECQTLCRTDVFPLERYIDMLVLWHKLREYLQANPHYYTVYDSKIIRNERMVRGELRKTEKVVQVPKKRAIVPELANYRMISRDLLRFEIEWGLTPAARTKITISQKTGNQIGDDDGDEFGLDE